MRLRLHPSKIFLAPVALSLIIMVVNVSVASASTFGEIIKGLGKTGTAAGYPVGADNAPKQGFIEFFTTYINGFFAMIGALFMVLVIYGGWLWMTAQGKEDQVTRAKQLLLHAVIGLGVIIGGRLIIELALLALGQATK